MLQGIHILKSSFFFLLIIVGLIIFNCFLLSDICFAHKVNVFAYVEGQKVHTESYFNDGKKCQQAQIVVFDSNNNQLLQGKTDEKGEFSFIPPLKTDLRIVLIASMGHRAEFIVQAEELEYLDEAREDSIPEEEKASPDEREKKIVPDNEINVINREELKSIMEEILDKKLAPIIRMHAKKEADRGITFHDIVGGVGYILGLMGVVFLFRPKK